jgi:rhodanese-related sulfurtransferase
VSSDPAVDIDPHEARRLLGAGAFLLDVGQVAERSDEIPKEGTVVCVCRVGGRSGSVAGALAGSGYDVRNIDGGMLAWEAAGYPVVTDGGDAGRVI